MSEPTKSDRSENRDRTPRWLLIMAAAMLVVGGGVVAIVVTTSPSATASAPDSDPMIEVLVGQNHSVVILNDTAEIDRLSVQGPNDRTLWILPVDDGERTVTFPMEDSRVHWCHDNNGFPGRVDPPIYDDETGVGIGADAAPLAPGTYTVSAIVGHGDGTGETIQQITFNVSYMLGNVPNSVGQNNRTTLCDGTVGGVVLDGGVDQ